MSKEQVELQTYGHVHLDKPRLFLRRATYFDGCVEFSTPTRVLAIVRRDDLERALREVSL